MSHGILVRLPRQVGIVLHDWIDRLRAANPDVSDDDWQIVQAVRRYTMVGTARLVATIDAVRYVCRIGVPGALVEAGVWRGGSLMAMWLASDRTREVWGYDTYTGMPEPGQYDTTRVGWQTAMSAWRTRPTWCAASYSEVLRNLHRVRCGGDLLHLVEGDVADTLHHEPPDPIAVLRLDTDWYESVGECLRVLYPRLSPGGVLLIDDYGHWDGARRAVDEFFGGGVLLHRTDYTGRVLVKA